MSLGPILIAGFGSVGQRHFRNLKALGCSDFVFQRTLKSTLSAEEIQGCPQVSTMEEALGYHPEIAFVTNPTSVHLPTAFQAARAGCHLFIEKPLSHQLQGCEELAAISRKANLVTMIGCQHRFHPLLLSLRDGILKGNLGKILEARADYADYLPAWHPWEDHRLGYSARRDLGGGVILTLIHPIDYLYWMFGPVGDVHASVSRVGSLQTDVDDDVADITLEFTSGVNARVHLDYIQRPPVHNLTVRGEKGQARLDFLAGHLSWVLSDGMSETVISPTGFERNTMFVDEIKHFLECVGQGKPTLTPLCDGIEVLKIALRAKEDASRRSS